MSAFHPSQTSRASALRQFGSSTASCSVRAWCSRWQATLATFNGPVSWRARRLLVKVTDPRACKLTGKALGLNPGGAWRSDGSGVVLQGFLKRLIRVGALIVTL